MPNPSVGPVLPSPSSGPGLDSGELLPVLPEEDGPESSSAGALFCNADSDCGGDFICIPERAPGLGFCAKGDFCFCIPIPPPKCNRQEDCVVPELCVFLNDAYTLCVDDLVYFSSSNLSPPQPTSGFTPEPQALFCEMDSDCSPDICIPEGQVGLGICGPGKFCFCAATTTTCAFGEDCSGSDVCVIVDNSNAFCVDEEVFEASNQLLKAPDGAAESSPSADSESSVFCETDLECGAGLCIQANGTYAQPCSPSDLGPCFCIAFPIRFCADFFGCVAEDEVCTVLSGAFTTCISEKVIESSDSLVPLSVVSPEPDLIPSEIPEKFPSESGPPALFCNSDADCDGYCIPEAVRGLGICDFGQFCFCIPLPPPSCVSSSSCEEGQVCVLVSDTDAICVDQEVFDSSASY